jgi:ABC-type branched-subunit amino acid transport system ATPase component
LATSLLSLDRVNAYYGDSHVLHDVSLELHHGRLLALLGRNGAGKTTCISTIIGFLPPRNGGISLAGVPIARLRACGNVRTSWPAACRAASSRCSRSGGH